MTELLDSVEIPATQGEATASVIWLHGLGSDGHECEAIAPMLELPWLRYLAPHAERRQVTAYGRYVMRAWYDLLSLDRSATRESEPDIRASQARIEALIRRENERGIPSERIALLGFSQGGAMALHVGLRWAEPLAGIGALSAYLLLPERTAQERSSANAKTPVLLCHGTRDPVVPISLGRSARALILSLDPGRPVRWYDYPIAHVVCREEISDVARFLDELLPRESPPRHTARAAA